MHNVLVKKHQIRGKKNHETLPFSFHNTSQKLDAYSSSTLMPSREVNLRAFPNHSTGETSGVELLDY